MKTEKKKTQPKNPTSKLVSSESIYKSRNNSYMEKGSEEL